MRAGQFRQHLIEFNHMDLSLRFVAESDYKTSVPGVPSPMLRKIPAAISIRLVHLELRFQKSLKVDGKIIVLGSKRADQISELPPCRPIRRKLQQARVSRT